MSEVSSSKSGLSDFDQLRATLPNYHYKPVEYTSLHQNLKYKKMCVRYHESEIRQQLNKFQFSAEKKIILSRLMSYYPGTSRYKPISSQVSPPSSTSFNFDKSADDKDTIPLFEGWPDYTQQSSDIPVPLTPSPISKKPRIDEPLTGSSTDHSQHRSFYASTPVPLIRESTPELQETKSYDLSPALSNLSINRRSETDKVENKNLINSLSENQSNECDASVTESLSGNLSNRLLLSNLHFIKFGKICKKTKVPFVRIASTRLRKRPSICKIPKKKDEPLIRPFPADQESSPSSIFPCIFLLAPFIVREETKESIIKFVHKFKAFWMNKFDPRVTHVVVEIEVLTHLITYKKIVSNIKFEYLQAVAYKKYLVSENWIEDCLDEGKILDARKYEVALDPDTLVIPTRIARKITKKLFEGFAFLCVKPFIDFTQVQLEEMLAFNGGIIAKLPEDLELFEEKIRICIIGELSYWNEKNKLLLKSKLEKYAIVHFDWISKCFCSYKVSSITPYLFGMSIKEAKKMGVPAELLKSRTIEELFQ